MERIIRLGSAFHELIWGTEDWLISAHQNGESKVIGGKFDGKKLSDLFKENKEIFGNIESNEFPLLIKIIDAKTALSIQVHPGDEYARKHENSLGKTECWYILDEKDSDIIVGQKAKSREEFQKAIDEKKVMDIMDVMDIKKGDFFYIPAGTVHAIRDNTKILEIQQSSDVTYRLYDYDRKDKDGNLRELHIDKSLDVIDYDYKYTKTNTNNKQVGTSSCEELVNEKYFSVDKYTINDKLSITNDKPFLLGVVTIGSLKVNGETINAEEGFIIPNGVDLEVEGNGELFISYV